jgi:TipAS antibiotic-recognition domain
VFEYTPICEHPFVMLADALLLLIELADRAAELGPAEIEHGQAAWVELSEEIERERAAVTDPADPRVQQLLERVDALIEAFTGGDPEMGASLERMYAEEGPERASAGWS